MGALTSGVKALKKKSMKSLIGTSRQDPSPPRETTPPRRVRRPARVPTPPRVEEEEDDDDDEAYEADEAEEAEGSKSDVSVVPEADSEEEEEEEEEYLEEPPDGGMWMINTQLEWSQPPGEYVETDPAILACPEGKYNQRGAASLPDLPYAHEKFVLLPQGPRYLLILCFQFRLFTMF